MTSRNNTFLLILILLFCFNDLEAQTDISIGTWKSHLPYQVGRNLTQSPDHMIYSTLWGVIYIDKEDNSSRTMDKTNGLSGVGIDQIKYNEANDILLVAYSNSIIDLVKPTETITLSDIQRFNNIAGDKRIYDIFMDSDSTALLATGYGISKINFKQDIFLFSTFTGVRINSILVKDDMIYATTEEGIYRAPNQSNVNLQDFGEWDLLDDSFGFPATYSAGAIVEYNNQLYIGIDTSLYRYDNGVLENIHTPGNGFKVLFLTGDGTHLVIGLECIVEDDFACQGSLSFMASDGNFTQVSQGCVNIPLDALQDENGDIWIADAWYRFRKFNVDNGFCDPGYVLNSPFDIKNYDLEVKDGDLWVTAGGVTIKNDFQFWFEGFYNKIDGEWNYYNRLNRQDLAGTLDFLNFAFHPEQDITYISTYYDGLIKYENNSFEIIIDTNSILGNPTFGDVARTKIGGLEFDEDNNLWIANPGYSRPIAVITTDGQMKNYSLKNPNVDELFNLAIDDNGFKWFTVSDGTAGLVVFDEGDLGITGDEDERIITAGNSALPSNEVKSIAKDLDGDIWVGTTDGIIIFDCGSSAFDEMQCPGNRKIVEQDGIPAYLLVGEDVGTITVDGANRKWVGTNNGVFVLSPDGEELIAKFNVDNSPLFANAITDIAIDEKSGEVYIGTADGIVSYRAEATLGGRTHTADPLVFPNPVRPEYAGPIAIRGLARDSNVKITDINGQLVFETTAFGGQAIWNGKDYSGRKAASGVYLVLGTTTKDFEEPQSVVAKILFVN